MADNITLEALKEELEKLRSEAKKSKPEISYSAMEASIKRIREAVSKNICAWEDLEITEEDFTLLEFQCFDVQLSTVVGAHTTSINRAKSLLYDFKKGTFNNSPAKAQIVFDIISKAVAMALITLEEMVTTRKELEEALKKITG